MNFALIAIFLILGIGFFILEIFFLPGVTIGGIAGTVFTVAAVWYAFAYVGVKAGWLTVTVGVVLFLLAVWIFIKSKILEKMSLKKELDGSDSPWEMDKVMVGDKGKTLSRLAPMGKVLINGNEYEAKSIDELIAPDQYIEVEEIDGQTLIVKTVNK